MFAPQVLAKVAASNFAASSAWYERLFGRAPDHRPNLCCAEWQIADSASIQLLDCHDDAITATPRRRSRAVGIKVADLDRALTELRQREIQVSPVQEVTHYLRFAPVADPDGNMVTFFESAHV